ncbi:MAG: hypothetical protein HYY87_03420 [Candidatus Levybacteria bacterium]|nr:hypothetical protein [Candidatus Levybacteria bacterium]MBI3070326.1 hypothetical protein [Candidatus Levybacteria bacterium]MBI3092964.1 hypothetical protein [Candidatus Levybacteria bacterium]
MKNCKSKSILFGLLGSLGLLLFYFSILTFISGWEFALVQFLGFWYFILALAGGFGMQVGLYSYLKMLKPFGLAQGGQVQHDKNGRVVAVSGTTSTLAMISCCSHYLVNLLPIIGITGFITLVSQYQIQLFWVGILANLLGITYMLRKIIQVRKI